MSEKYAGLQQSIGVSQTRKAAFFGLVNEGLCNKRPIADCCLKCLVLLYGSANKGAFCKEQFAS